MLKQRGVPELGFENGFLVRNEGIRIAVNAIQIGMATDYERPVRLRMHRRVVPQPRIGRVGIVVKTVW